MSLLGRKAVGIGYFDLVYIRVLVLGFRGVQLLYKYSNLLKVSSVLRKNYHGECMFDNTIFYISIKVYLYFFYRIYLSLQVIFQATLLYFLLHSAIYLFKTFLTNNLHT